jgi:hypothetical protein
MLWMGQTVLYLLQLGEQGILQICHTNYEYLHYFILLNSLIFQQLISSHITDRRSCAKLFCKNHEWSFWEESYNSILINEIIVFHYDTTFKLMVIKHTDETNNCSIERNFHVQNRKHIWHWQDSKPVMIGI